MSQDTDFVATGPSSVGFRTGPGQPLNIETGGLFEGKNVGVEGKADLGAGVSGNSVSDDGVVGTTSTVGKSGVFGFNTQSNGAAFGVSGGHEQGERWSRWVLERRWQERGLRLQHSIERGRVWRQWKQWIA
jgi:hypothetical protein